MTNAHNQIPSGIRTRIRTALLRWYDCNKRDLPWRRTRDPYAIWVSETMLQQTRVGTVLPYYHRFMKVFPSVEALDQAPLDAVRNVWSGLGYYQRAANLKKAASVLMNRHNGQIPADYQALLCLPGGGQYTAGAVLSIAFDRRYSAPDGNARRVYARLVGLTDPRAINEMAGQMVSHVRPGDFNQAVMELGATVCLPAKPRCERCPLAYRCHAKSVGAFKLQLRRPTRTKAVQWPLTLAKWRSRILLHRRPDTGILASLWELPTPKSLPAEIIDETFQRGDPVALIHHSITDMRITAPVYLLQCKIPVKGPEWRWVNPANLHTYPLSSLSTKALSAARQHLPTTRN